MVETTKISVLNGEQRRELRAAAHRLHPVVSISQNGLAESVLKEIDRCLAAHELIKVKLHGVERDERAALLDQVCTRLGCAPVQQIGNVLVLWRENPAKREKAIAAKTTRRPAKPMTKKQAAAAAEQPRRRTARTTRT
jgi:putative YhbY family RNA-binding protein